MTNITYTSHPLVTVEHRPGGPVVIHDRRGPEEDVHRNRVKMVIAGFIGIALLGFLLLLSWRAGDLDGTDVRNAVVAGLILIAVVGYRFVVGQGRVEIEAVGNQLQIRAWPLDIDYGGSVDLNQIDHLQVEKDNEFGRDKYRVQIVGRDGQGLLPSFRVLSDINTQDEATGVAGAVAQQFGLRAMHGIQPAAAYLSGPNEGPALASDKNSATVESPGSFLPGISDGRIRVKQAREGSVVSYTLGLMTKGSNVAFSIVWFLMVGSFTTNFLRNLNGAGELAGLAVLSIFWAAGFFMLFNILAQQEIYRDGDNLVTHFRLGPLRVSSRRIHTSDLDRVGVEVYWDSYHVMHHRIVAHAKKGSNLTILDPISQIDGQALCHALHKHLGVPI